ncbi:MAG: UDP-N-acetylmuramoyl-tripeptide--D-alanyl-D-alanine ligase [Chlorobi bacterium]|nr:UDP-N-acetylmuramoyl-tripeptide--D-alanyl-D-alanine ligase [Chlorobiota bacterium]
MEISKLYRIYKRFSAICTDSRKASVNSIFFALTGENFDGNKFVKLALKKCKYAVIDDKNYYIDERTILVNNSLLTLQQLAGYHRKKLNIPIIAITGTNGKTTTKELIKDVLSQKYKVIATSGNFNNHIGVPLTLLRMSSETEIGIVEMGANHLNEISSYCNIAQPNYGIITNIGNAHLEGFGSFKNIVNAKNELYQFINKEKGTIFLNKKNELLINLQAGKNVVYYNDNESIKIIKKPQNIFLSFMYNNITFNTKLVGNYNLENVLAAISIGEYFKVGNDKIKFAIENYSPTNIRSQFKKTEFNSLIIDTYNANPSSMELAIDNFHKLNLENKLMILGDMFELGENSSKEHSKIIELVKTLKFKNVIFVGKDFSKFSDENNYLFFYSTKLLIDWLQLNKIEQKNILIKGSRGMQLEKIIDFL